MSLRCKTSRTIRTSKYERNDPEIRTWWYKFFEFLEADKEIPPYKRVGDLGEFFTSKVDREFAEKCVLQCLKTVHEPKTVINRSYDNASYERQKRKVGRDNPYLKFFSRDPEKVVIWHPPPVIPLEEMKLTDRAEAITKQIATNFVQWMNEMSKETPNTYDVTTIMKLFEVGLFTHAAKSLCVKQYELPSVPDTVSKLENVPQLAKRVRLHAFIQQDLEAAKQPRRQFGFGRRLPVHLQCYPPNATIAKPFTTCRKLPKELATMETVWRDILTLRSTWGFCEWLLDRPDVKPPEYLVENNMLDPKVLAGPRFSADIPELADYE